MGPDPDPDLPGGPPVFFCLQCAQLCLSSASVIFTVYVPTFLLASLSTAHRTPVNVPTLRTAPASVLTASKSLEGHRYELISLVAWVNQFWSSGPGPNRSLGVDPLSDDALFELARYIHRLARAFVSLVRSHINAHGLQPGCSYAKRSAYRLWLQNRPLLPRIVSSSLSQIESLAECAVGHYRSEGTEQNIRLWYGTVNNFRRGVTRVVPQVVCDERVCQNEISR
ncbi:hypothetical protein N7491_009059 [Penicillium cf. griseofulvum]|uniref:Uncharacterized protein n=1 Tax=Penicillium cf. griseofulvum TaxID=2972120 RepID=A0A9W9MF27_9EURO|nr:hypothetical protein N7472_005344 [Penicillium cf. griseofulvum]KAJ5423843.1 hypothetical protein N7491_009059 [Penicillium cf. griseofulvum]KAJ5430903.1 hypothetical protein N7445_008635 [Penicillium cf. griseofulvum]